MTKIKLGYLILSFPDTIEIYVDEFTGVKYIMTGHDYYEGDCYCSGLTPLIDENGKPEKFTKEEVAYLKTLATNISDTLSSDSGLYQRRRRKRRTPEVAYYSMEL